MTIFEIGGTYLVHRERNFSVIGGLRTYSLSPKLQFQGDAGRVLTPVDTGRTTADVFGGFTFRPKLSEKITLLTRGDVGAGESNFTWSGTLGFEYQVKPWAGLMLGYRALGIDTGDVQAVAAKSGTGTVATEYDVTHYGPVFGLTLHWSQK